MVAGSAQGREARTEMTIRTKLARHLVFPAADLVRRRGITKAIYELEATQWWPRSRLLDLQAKRLKKLISHAYQWVPYYREAMEFRNLTPSDLSGPAALPKFPLLTREQVRANYPDKLCSLKVPRDGWRERRTGGSTTGEPLFLTYDRPTMDYGRAAYYRALAWIGCPVGTPTLSLWGEPVTRRSKHDAITEKVRQIALGVHHISAYRLDNALLAKAAAILRHGHVPFIYAYPSSLLELCRFLRSHGVEPSGIRSVVTTAEVLLPESRAYVEETLRAPVFNAYGCAEVNGIANECDRQDGLHISMEHVIVEIVDDNGTPVKPGQSGHIAVTDLHNYAMPVIRYVNGDEGQLVAHPCTCGRQLDRLEGILGRTCDIIDGANGRQVHSSLFEHVFGAQRWALTHGLTRFQIIQETDSLLRLRLIMRRRPSSGEQEQLVDKLTEFLGPLSYQIEFPERIEPGPSGKLRPTINRLRSNHPAGQ